MARAGTKSTQASQGNASRGKKKSSQGSEEESSGAGSYDEDAPPRASQPATKKGKSTASAAASITHADLRKKVNDLVRLALYTEPKRSFIKRETINDKVLGVANAKIFTMVFDAAQRILRDTFGMELVELMSRGERELVLDGGLDDTSHNKKKVPTSKTYILRNILDSELVKLATTPDNALLTAEIAEVQDATARSRINGTLLSWKSQEEIHLLGILQLILSLILVSGRSMTDALLKRQIGNLGLVPNSQIEIGPLSTTERMNMEDYLSHLMKQSYLDRVKVSVPGTQAPAASQAPRRKNRANDDDDQATYEWRWGSRAHAEISERSVAEFMVDFMKERFIQQQLEEEEDNDDRGRAAPSTKAREAAEKYAKNIMKDIVRAAGGTLTEAKSHD